MEWAKFFKQISLSALWGNRLSGARVAAGSPGRRLMQVGGDVGWTRVVTT